MARTPPSKPKAPRKTVVAAATRQWQIDHPGKPLPEFFVLAVRAYYDATFAPAGNNISEYDDAFFIVSPDKMTAWNGNTDPSRYGWNAGAGKFMARLRVGCWKMVRWKHKGKYWAFGQGSHPVTVDRIRQDGTIAMSETGQFGINLHEGGNFGTSSEGCPTVPKPQWPSFQNTLQTNLDASRQGYFDFILIDGPIT